LGLLALALQEVGGEPLLGLLARERQTGIVGQDRRHLGEGRERRFEIPRRQLRQRFLEGIPGEPEADQFSLILAYVPRLRTDVGPVLGPADDATERGPEPDRLALRLDPGEEAAVGAERDPFLRPDRGSE